ncbi:aromatase/cyclase [Streptomyces sp. NPDC090022]|uniref:aromatase/cyclase n=1 Tax=Streptomyces sp. NPDC090022 TaxID=3365920 RepID=UPI00382EAABC
MPTEQVHRTSHQVTADAPAATVYGLLADAERWPLLFPPTVHVRRLDTRDGGDGSRVERLAIWATANGTLKHWTSRRALDPAARRIGFRQETPAPPLRSMGGTWIVDALGADRSRVTLLHDFTVVDDRPDDVAWVLRATDTNSRSELGRLAALASRPRRLDGMLFTFADSLRFRAPAVTVLDHLDHAALWPGAAPTVALRLPETGEVVFKTPEPPAPLSVHTGGWTVDADGPDGVVVTVRQQVVLRAEDDVPRARQDVREEAGRVARTALTRLRDRNELIPSSA